MIPKRYQSHRIPETLAKWVEAKAEAADEAKAKSDTETETETEDDADAELSWLTNSILKLQM